MMDPDMGIRLSAEQVAALFSRYHNRDSRKARELLILLHTRLAYWVARRVEIRLGLRRQEMDDARGDAVLGLIQAVDSYAPERGGFIGFATKIIWRRAIDGYRARRSIQTLSMDAPREDGSPLHDTLADDRPSVLSELERADEVRDLRFALTILPERDRGMVWGRYAEDRPLSEVGPKHGVTAGWASAVSLRALDRLRKHYGVTVSVAPRPRRHRSLDGRRNARRKIDEGHVRQIHRRILAGEETQREIARSLGISEGQLSLIKTGRRWRSVFEEFNCKEMAS